jgi:hypothetical protein
LWFLTAYGAIDWTRSAWYKGVIYLVVNRHSNWGTAESKQNM